MWPLPPTADEDDVQPFDSGDGLQCKFRPLFRNQIAYAHDDLFVSQRPTVSRDILSSGKKGSIHSIAEHRDPVFGDAKADERILQRCGNGNNTGGCLNRLRICFSGPGICAIRLTSVPRADSTKVYRSVCDLGGGNAIR